MNNRLLVSFGTRPEVIKLAPLVQTLCERGADVTTCAIAQHRELLDQALRVFGLRPDLDLDCMEPEQDVARLVARILGRMDEVLDVVKPDLLVVQGDTAAALSAALAAHARRVPVAHVEAGLRTESPNDPWPEEMNRRIITRLASMHFAPTSAAAQNLRREGVDAEAIVVTGNTSMDAIRLVHQPQAMRAGTDVVVTCHRREHHADGFRSARDFIAEVASALPNTRFVLALHPHPRAQALRGLGRTPNITVVEAMDYPQMLATIADAKAVVTDSGGLQEECAYFGTPCIVTRRVTDRPESVTAGNAVVTGLDVAAATAALRRAEPTPCTRGIFGDGFAADRIADVLLGRQWTQT